MTSSVSCLHRCRRQTEMDGRNMEKTWLTQVNLENACKIIVVVVNDIVCKLKNKELFCNCQLCKAVKAPWFVLGSVLWHELQVPTFGKELMKPLRSSTRTLKSSKWPNPPGDEIQHSSTGEAEKADGSPSPKAIITAMRSPSFDKQVPPDLWEIPGWQLVLGSLTFRKKLKLQDWADQLDARNAVAVKTARRVNFSFTPVHTK